MHKVLINLLTKEVLSIPALKGVKENIRYQSEKTAGAETLSGSVFWAIQRTPRKAELLEWTISSEGSGLLSQFLLTKAASAAGKVIVRPLGFTLSEMERKEGFEQGLGMVCVI